jgi:hypothetical protein
VSEDSDRETAGRPVLGPGEFYRLPCSALGESKSASRAIVLFGLVIVAAKELNTLMIIIIAAEIYCAIQFSLQ